MQVRPCGFVILLMVCTAILLLADPAQAQWNLYEEASIAGTISGSIRKGHIFKTRSGNIYEVVDYVYLYEYEYNPDVLVLSDGNLYKLIIEGFNEPLLCKCLNCSKAGAQTIPSTSQSEELAIRAAQTALAALGFDAGATDGTLSTRTRLAVKEFRISNGLSPTDSLDAATLRIIAIALTKAYPDKSEILSVAVYLLQASENWPPAQHTQESPESAAVTSKVVDSYIISDFKGLNHGNIYQLANDQIWEQTEYWIWVWYWVNPKVLIWLEGGIYRMKVEGIDHQVMVRRLK